MPDGRLRIESDGVGSGTVVTLDGDPVPALTALTYSIEVGGVGTAVLTGDLVAIAADAIDWDWKRFTLKQRLRLVSWAFKGEIR